MRSQSLPIALASGRSKQLLLETDDQSGRTAIRVDGRPVARPLAAAEEERELTVDATKFILRRMPNGEFTIDYAPPDVSAGRQWVPPGVKPASTGTGRKKAAKTGGSIAATIAFIVMAKLTASFLTGGMAGSEKVELSQFECVRSVSNVIEAAGTVTNTSTAPIALNVTITVRTTDSLISIPFKGEVTPKPLQPGGKGTFLLRQTLNASGDGRCKVSFTDDSGSTVRYKVSGDAARTMSR